mgnify:CR=1 FL=1
MFAALTVMSIFAATPTLSAEVGVRSLLVGEPRQFAAVRLIEPIANLNTLIEVMGDRDFFGSNARAHLRVGVGATRWQVRLAATRVGENFEPSGEVRIKLMPKVTVFAEGNLNLTSSLLRVGARYANERLSWTLEGTTKGDASMVVSYSFI